MDQTDRSSFTWLWWSVGIIAIAGLALYFMPPQIKPITPAQKKAAFSRAHILVIYATIEQLEDSRGKLLAQIVKEKGDPGNINSLICRLAKEDNLSNLNVLPITNIAGVEQLIDEWGHPYNIKLVPEMGTNHGSVERRVNISFADGNL